MNHGKIAVQETKGTVLSVTTNTPYKGYRGHLNRFFHLLNSSFHPLETNMVTFVTILLFTNANQKLWMLSARKRAWELSR